MVWVWVDRLTFRDITKRLELATHEDFARVGGQRRRGAVSPRAHRAGGQRNLTVVIQDYDLEN